MSAVTSFSVSLGTWNPAVFIPAGVTSDLPHGLSTLITDSLLVSLWPSLTSPWVVLAYDRLISCWWAQGLAMSLLPTISVSHCYVPSTTKVRALNTAIPLLARLHEVPAVFSWLESTAIQVVPSLSSHVWCSVREKAAGLGPDGFLFIFMYSQGFFSLIW